MGLSREQVPFAMRRAGIARELIPCAKTIYNVEVDGRVPIVRVKFALAQFYGRSPRDIWGAA